MQVGNLIRLRLLDVHANPRLRHLPRTLLQSPLVHQLRLVVTSPQVYSRASNAAHLAGAWCSELRDKLQERLLVKARVQGMWCN